MTIDKFICHLPFEAKAFKKRIRHQESFSPVLTQIWHNNPWGDGSMIELPEYARVVRTLGCGEHHYLALLPRVSESPAVGRITSPTTPLENILRTACVRIQAGEGYVRVYEEIPAIVLMEEYYRRGRDLDLYLDLLHELTHLRQHAEGHPLWDKRFAYVDRPTEIEGYAVAVEEGRRLGMSRSDIIRHLSNPWMTRADTRRLLENVDRFLSNTAIPASPR
jgi:hypothetical protein